MGSELGVPTVSHLREMHPIGVYPGPSVLRPLGRIPSQIPLGGQRTRQWRRQYPIIPEPRPKSSNENDGTSRSNPPKLVPNHVLCLETLPTSYRKATYLQTFSQKKRKIRKFSQKFLKTLNIKENQNYTKKSANLKTYPHSLCCHTHIQTTIRTF